MPIPAQFLLYYYNFYGFPVFGISGFILQFLVSQGGLRGCAKNSIIHDSGIQSF